MTSWQRLLATAARQWLLVDEMSSLLQCEIGLVVAGADTGNPRTGALQVDTEPG